MAIPSAPTIQAINAVDWSANPKSIPVKGTLKFKNSSEDNHFVGMARLKDGKTMADFDAWIKKAASGQNPGPDPVDGSAPEIDTGVLSPGKSMAQKYKLIPGTYVIICWWPDADMDNMPHAFMGMYRGITVK